MKTRLLDTLIVVLVVFFMAAVFMPFSAKAAREGTLQFSWSPDPDVVAEQGIVALNVYQDSSDNTPSTADPLTGEITVQTTIDGCSNFWATYSTDTHESERTDPPIEVCEPGLDDPDPVTQVISVGGFQLTIDFKPLEEN